MYPVSQDFLQKMTDYIRDIRAKIQIDYTDPFLDQSIEVSTSEQANISFPAQIADSVAEPFAKIASLDGSWMLDGTFALASESEDVLLQMGWWGNQLAGADGGFTIPYPTLTVTFFSRPITHLKVVGDTKRREYPVDFDINLYNDNILYTETVTNNTQVTWQKTLSSAITQVTKMDLIIKRWSHAGRQIKILEFFTSIQEVYEGDDILLIHLLEEREISQGSLPVGNISANEINMRLNNSTRKFDAGNKHSSLYQLLKQNRRIRAWLGIERDDRAEEWVPLGVFWSGEWSVPEDGIYAQITAWDRLELLRKSTYSTSTVQQDKTLYDLAVAVLQDAGLTSNDYWLDPNLQNYIVPYAYFESQSHREALRKVAEACLGQVYCDREGVIRVETIDFTYKRLNQFVTPFLVTFDGVSVTEENYFRKDRPVKWGQIANYIEVETQPLRPDIVQEVYRSNDPISIAAWETKTLTVYYNQTPCINAVASLEGATNTVIIVATYYAWGADIKLKNNGTVAENVTIVINAQPMKILNREKAIAQDGQSIIDNGLIRYTFANPLIQILSMAQTIANKLLQSFKDPRRDVDMEWRGNPALLLGDIVTIQENDHFEDFFVIKRELEFDGALRDKLTGRKM
jgi:hypothetical protein